MRKNLAILIAKLIARGLIPLNLQMKKDLAAMCRSWLSSGAREESEGALDVIASLAVRQSVIIITREIFANLFI